MQRAKNSTAGSFRSPSIEAPDLSRLVENASQQMVTLSPTEQRSVEATPVLYMHIQENRRSIGSSIVGKRKAKGWSSMIPSLTPDVVAKNMTAYKQQRYSVQMSRTYYGTGI